MLIGKRVKRFEIVMMSAEELMKHLKDSTNFSYINKFKEELLFIE